MVSSLRSSALQDQQEGEDVEEEALEVEAVLGAGVEHLLGRIVLGHIRKILG